MLQSILSLVFFFSFSNQNPQHTLSIELSGLESKSGSIMLRVLNNNEDMVKQAIYPLKETKSKITLQLPEGSYSIAVFHDENNNKELDKTLIGIPKEKYGFSNNPPAIFGPPPFKDQLITLNKDLRIEIKLI